MTSTAKKSTTEAKSAKTQDAISLLRADHKLVEQLFEQYEKTRSPAKKQEIIEEICAELTIHAQIEEEIFYPQAQNALKDNERVPEAEVEHATLKSLIAQLQEEDRDANAEMYDAKVKVLCEYVQHHVKAEQNEVLPKVRESKLDLTDLAEQLQERKQDLQARLD